MFVFSIYVDMIPYILFSLAEIVMA